MNEFRECMDAALKQILSRFDNVEDRLDRLFRVKNSLDGDELMDNQDMCFLLGVTKQTLYRYRKKGILKYYMVDNGKVYYKKSEIPEFLLKKNSR